MKHLKTYTEQSKLCNESLRDMMKPKSDDEIEDAIKNLPNEKRVYYFIKHGMIDELKKVFENSSIDVNTEAANFLLKKVSKPGDEEMLIYLLNNERFHYDDKGYTLLFYDVVHRNRTELAKIILEKFDVNLVTKSNWLLRAPVHHGHLDMLKLLVKHGADINSIDERSIDVARERGHDNIIEYINKKRRIR